MRPLCPRGGNRRENLWPFQRLCVQTPKTRQCQHHCNPSLWSLSSRHLLIIVIGIINITMNLEFSFFNLWLNLLCRSEVKMCCFCRKFAETVKMAMRRLHATSLRDSEKKESKVELQHCHQWFCGQKFLCQPVRLERGQLTVRNLNLVWKRLTKVVLFSSYFL